VSANPTSVKPSTAFNVRYAGDPIMGVTPRHTVRSAVSYGIAHPDLVPPFEEHSIRQDAGFSVASWYAMNPRERALEVAVHRLRSHIGLLQNAEMVDQMKRKQKGRR